MLGLAPRPDRDALAAGVLTLLDAGLRADGVAEKEWAVTVLGGQYA